MINQQLLNPQSIAVIGGSDDIHKPGGKVLYNIIKGNYKGKLYVANPKQEEVQGIKSYKDVNDLPQTDLAILAIAAKFCTDSIKILAETKNTKAFIILSAGFSETSEEGALIEQEIVNIINNVNGVLIGPNGIGVLTPNYHGVFTSPIPKLDSQGVDFISGSGATAVFIMELGIPNGLRFANVFSVGNSAQTGVEEVLEYMDNTYEEGISPKVKLLYLEQIDKPQKLLKHASSLIRKGCKIAAVKSGSSDAGSRAASSHTGALASSDVAVDTLFKKAGIVRCYGRQELITVASVFMLPELKGKNIAIITHAGGPAVMLTDALEKGGLNIPQIKGKKADELLEKLYPGSSVANPIDFLATGTAEQLDNIIDACENNFEEIDAMAVIFGTPGLSKVFDAYDVINEKMQKCKKPIYPVLPSLNEAKEEIKDFISKNRVFFPEEVLLGNALSKVYFTDKPANENIQLPEVDTNTIRNIIETSEDGYLEPEKVQNLLDAAGINRAKEFVAETLEDALQKVKKIAFPVVLKVVGPVHKSDVGGVVLNVKNEEQLTSEFNRMIKIKDTTAILMQPMLSGTELFAGAKYEDKFGHLVLAGMGGIFIEVFKDISSVLSPVSKQEAEKMIKSLKSYKLIEGTRGQEGINQEKFIDIIIRLSALLEAAPEIIETDLNPLLGTATDVIAVDARIRIKK
ncbi:MAG: acetate--CoA ligase family protein [Bacteroidales bacterium]|nr:acetate--CoA ligase family protein [Bacteroidales bacterium]